MGRRWSGLMQDEEKIPKRNRWRGQWEAPMMGLWSTLSSGQRPSFRCCRCVMLWDYRDFELIHEIFSILGLLAWRSFTTSKFGESCEFKLPLLVFVLWHLAFLGYHIFEAWFSCTLLRGTHSWRQTGFLLHIHLFSIISLSSFQAQDFWFKQQQPHLNSNRHTDLLEPIPWDHFIEEFFTFVNRDYLLEVLLRQVSFLLISFYC